MGCLLCRLLGGKAYTPPDLITVVTCDLWGQRHSESLVHSFSLFTSLTKIRTRQTLSFLAFIGLSYLCTRTEPLCLGMEQLLLHGNMFSWQKKSDLWLSLYVPAVGYWVACTVEMTADKHSWDANCVGWGGIKHKLKQVDSCFHQWGKVQRQ